MALLTREVAYQLIEEQGTDIVIPDIYTSIDQSAFSLSDLTSVVIPESVTSIGALAFWNNDLTSVAIPDSVTTIRVGAFANNPLTSVYIGDNVTSIGETFLGDGDWEFAFTYAPLEFVSISADAPFPVSLFPEGVLIDYRGVDQYPVDMDIFASTSNFIENIAGGSAVATLSTADPDANGTHAYALVAGDGDADNNAFAIDGDKLKILNSPDFET